MRIGHERGQIHGQGHHGRAIGRMRIVEGGLGAPAADDGQIVALAAFNLTAKHGVERGGEFLVGAAIEAVAVASAKPIKIAPHLATVNFLRLVVWGN